MNVLALVIHRASQRAGHVPPRQQVHDPFSDGAGIELSAPGNLGIQSRLKARGAQAKLNIGQPDEPDEREADRVAERIMSPAPAAALGCACENSATCSSCEDKIQTKRDAGAGRQRSDVSPVDGASLGGGRPLPLAAREFFEPRFGADFSQVRVHTDPRTAESARALDARAFTIGRDIAFAAGQFSPDSESGRRLLAHELTHVLQQQGRCESVIRRQATAKPKVDINPAESMRSNIAEMQTAWLPPFQQALDAVSEGAIAKAGDAIAVCWTRIQSNYDDVPAQSAATATPDHPELAAKPADVENDYRASRRAVLQAVSAQTFRGEAVIGKTLTPNYAGSVLAYVHEQKAQIAWVAKDAAAAIALLKTDKLDEAGQWQVVGLFRQHLNPWHFAYMQKAVAAAGLDAQLKGLSDAPAKGYQTLTRTAAAVLQEGQVGPADTLGTIALLPGQRKVRLLQPMTAAEISGEIYGKPDKWQVLLLPFNAADLAGKGGDQWLPLGLELYVDPTMLKPEYAAVFAAATRARDKTEQGCSLRANGEPVAAVGNEITYYVQYPAGYWPDVNYEWWVENDPAAAATGKVDKTFRGPRGLKATDASRSHDTTWTLSALVPGNHVIRCRLTYGSTTEDLSYVQSVITVEQKLQIELTRGFDYGSDRPKDIAEKLQKDLDATPDTPANKNKREDLRRRIDDIRKSLVDAKDVFFDAIPATYVSSAGKPLRLPLRLFMGKDPKYNDADRGFNLKLWDYTLQGMPFTISASGERLYQAIHTLLATFADKCYYPKGKIAFQISPAHMGWTLNLPGDETVVHDTSGPKLIDEILRLLPPDVLRGISMGALGLAVVSGLAGQEEVAVPAFELSMYLSGAAAAGELAQKLEHGQFKWDLGTAMNVADLAAALIGLGGAVELTTTVQGVGRVSLTPAISGLQKGVGIVQIGLVAGLHTSEIAAAIASKDKEKVAAAILRALGDAAMFIIVHKAAGGGAREKPTPEPGRDVVPHENLRAAGTAEMTAADKHGVVVDKNGRPFRCSDECTALEWLFRQLLAERPQLAGKLQGIAELPEGQRLPAARELYEQLQGLEGVRNLSNTELADRIAKSKGKAGDESLIQELMRREGVDLSSADALGVHGMSEHHPPVVEYIDPVSGDRLPLYYNAETGKYVPADLHKAQTGNVFETVAEWGYEVNQLPLQARSGRRPVLDSYSPEKKEIVSRKFSQLAEVDYWTSLGYLQELRIKYPSGATVASTPLTRASGWAGRKVEGALILEVPVQKAPIPDRVLAEAAKRGISIRDVIGHVY